MTTGSLTVLFEDPFWIGLFEMIDQQGLRACKVTFGAEPKIERKQRSKAEREAAKQRQFDLRQAKKKEKHKGH